MSGPDPSLQPEHFDWALVNGIGIITLNRPERKTR